MATKPKSMIFFTAETEGQKTARETRRDKAVAAAVAFVTSKASGLAAIQAARLEFFDALAPLIIALRMECRYEAKKKGESAVWFRDWFGLSPEYRSAWTEKIAPLLRECTLSSTDADETEQKIAKAIPAVAHELKGDGMDSDYNALVQGVNRRVRRKLYASAAFQAELPDYVKAGGKIPGRKPGDTDTDEGTSKDRTFSLPKGTDAGDPEEVFAEVTVPEKVESIGIAKLSATLLQNVRYLRTMVAAAEERGTIISPDERNTTGNALANIMLLVAKRDDPVGILYMLAKLKTEEAEVELSSDDAVEEAGVVVEA